MHIFVMPAASDKTSVWLRKSWTSLSQQILKIAFTHFCVISRRSIDLKGQLNRSPSTLCASELASGKECDTQPNYSAESQLVKALLCHLLLLMIIHTGF